MLRAAARYGGLSKEVAEQRRRREEVGLGSGKEQNGLMP
jgi:hypothetical protein